MIEFKEGDILLLNTSFGEVIRVVKYSQIDRGYLPFVKGSGFTTSQIVKTIGTLTDYQITDKQLKELTYYDLNEKVSDLIKLSTKS